MKLVKNTSGLLIAAAVMALAGCRAKGNYPGTEYAPNMYNSVSYKPLKQVMDKSAGEWVSSIDNGVGEYYNGNPNNPHEMSMRVPPAHTVRRLDDGMLPYRIPKDSIELASRVLKDPYPATDDIIAQGKELYSRFCQPCHGENGMGSMDSTAHVGQVFKGVPSYHTGRVSKVTEGHIFHVITWGYNRMGSYGSQLSQEERWKVVRYVQTLQQQGN